MIFHILTIFPNIFDSYLRESILKRAQEKGKIKIKIYNLRDFTKNKHKKVDDRPFGGGPGMVLKVEPIYEAIKFIKSKLKTTYPPTALPSKGRAPRQKSKVILLSPRGKIFNQEMVHKLSKLDEIILICGRYEGVDERVRKYLADEEISIGNYILSGGELPALVIIEAISRLLPGVLGNIESIEEKREAGLPVYTRPAVFIPDSKEKWKVPKVLLSGDHKKIENWRKKHQKFFK